MGCVCEGGENGVVIVQYAACILVEAELERLKQEYFMTGASWAQIQILLQPELVTVAFCFAINNNFYLLKTLLLFIVVVFGLLVIVIIVVVVAIIIIVVR